MVEELKKGNKENISFINPTITNSAIITGENSGIINFVNQTKEKRKQQDQQDHEDDDTNIITVKRKKELFSLLKPITLNISYRYNTPGFDESVKSKMESIAYIKLDDNDICENEDINNEYTRNKGDSYNNKYISNYSIAKLFLNGALHQKIEDLLSWLGQHGFDNNNSKDNQQAILLIRLVLTDFYANCLKPTPSNPLNERTPFVEYVIPIFKYYSAVYNDLAFQWCEKGLETNKCIVYYNTDGKAKKRLADGVGYLVMDNNNENLLLESSGEENDDHTQEVTIKLLECSIRSLKLEMENVKDASFETFKKRRFFTYLYAGDKLTMLSTCIVDQEKWDYTMVREAVVPRTWSTRYRWVKVMDLIFCTKAMLEEQKNVSEVLESEHNGCTTVPQGTSIKCLSKLL